jgi:hypothetical protein
MGNLTLCQQALAFRLGMPVATIRARGETIIGVNEKGERETWLARRRQNGRLNGYELAALKEDNAQ